MDLKQIVCDLHTIQAVKFGSFTLKSGVLSPIYLDLRMIVSFPKILKAISHLLFEKIQHLSFDLLCGVPYTALPIATCMSVTHDIPMVLRRKEAKDYGTKKMIEGVFHRGQRCLIIEDVITSGASILETADQLEKEGLSLQDVAVVIDREQGGEKNLENRNLRLHSLLSLTQLLDILHQAHKINTETQKSVLEFLGAGSKK